MDKKMAIKEYNELKKIKTFGWSIDEIIDLENYLASLEEIIAKA